MFESVIVCKDAGSGELPLPKLNAALRKSCVKAGFSAAFLKKLRISCVFFRPALKL